MSKNIYDYLGKKYGHLTVIGLTESNSESACYNHFDFRCDCGNIISDEPARIIGGHRASCGKCSLRNKTSSPSFDIKKYIGKKSNMLTVIGIAERKANDKSWYLNCQCDCGGTIRVLPYQFDRGIIKSCGCLKRKGTRTKDSRTNHPLYGLWKQMISRCENPQVKHYDCYGGRGISVCKDWHDFWKFVEWSDSVGGRPNGFTLDRKDNNGNYEPSNCRWADWDTQANNKSSNIMLTYNGKTQSIQQWSKQLGMNPQTLLNRHNRGWSVEEILTTPANTERKSRKRPSVLQCDLSGNTLCTYENLSSIPKEFNKENVRMCCVGKRNTHKGYIWKYMDA